MMLRRRVLVTSLAVAVPAAALIVLAVETLRAHDMAQALDRVVRSQVNDQVRERCESDPNWFLTGPLEGRPPKGMFVERTPDELAPRAKLTAQPFQLFAYDERFTASSTGAPLFPPDFKRALRSFSDAVAPYATEGGTGAQMAVPTGWIGGPCMYFLGRMLPPPHQRRQRVLMATGAFGLCFAVAWLASVPTLRRVRRLSRDERESVAGGYRAIAPDKLRDELSALTFMFNDAATELHRRQTRIEDLDEALRRFVLSTEEEIARPLAQLEQRLGAAELDAGDARPAARDGLLAAHSLAARVENLIAAARLRMASAAVVPTAVALRALVQRVVERRQSIAHATGVAFDLSLPPDAVAITADEPLLERAIANVIDNAIQYNRSGGTVRVALAARGTGQVVALRVTNDGPELSDEEFKSLTTIKRFRGDESRHRRPGTRGLGLAVAQEVADRFGLTLTFERQPAGGVEVEMGKK